MEVYMGNIEYLYSSEWIKLKRPFSYHEYIGEFQIHLIKKNNKKKWVAIYKGDRLKKYENRFIYLPIHHASKSDSCIKKAFLESKIWAEQVLGYRNPNLQVSIDKSKYDLLNNDVFHFDWRDNRRDWGTDYIYSTITDDEEKYFVVFYIIYDPAHERLPEIYKNPKVTIGYYVEAYFNHALSVIDPHLDRIHSIANEYFKKSFDCVDYDIIYRSNYVDILIGI